MTGKHVQTYQNHYTPMETFKTIKSILYGPFIALFAYTGLSSELAGILTALILLDLFTGIIREYVMGCRITSRMIWIGTSSKLLLILIPVIVILVGKGANVDLLLLGKFTMSAFIVAEGYSIIGNIMQIRKGDVTIDEQDAITSIIKGIEGKFKLILATLMQK